jgi:exodeoxyribonuclease III
LKISTWNVNSLRAREDVVLDWIEEEQPDILCLQETKVIDQEFPEDAIADLHYDVVYTGEPKYNGVAILCREEIADVRREPRSVPDSARRVIAGTVSGIRIVNVYVPNGEALESDKYAYKLKWLDGLIEDIRRELENHQHLVLCGDFNIAPDKNDVWDADTRTGLFVSDAERTRFRKLLELGLVDAFRAKNGGVTAFTWWDYRGRSVDKNQGMRIDHLLITPDLARRARSVEIRHAVRTVEGPSDHVPVVLDLGALKP